MDIQKTALRLPRDIHQMVSEAARHAGHSMNAEIIARLRASFGDSHPQNDDLKEIVRGIVREELSKSGK
ncbi:Arc family DNA-binding protein [Thiothrix lacustris]|uniref:Arc family DNA-binding protein n=1 Tax=Thiothrix lacustris TaxID=525917 RepID=UPI003558CB71